MRKVINGKVYDTTTATKLAEASYGNPSDFGYWEEALYRTAKGALFVAGEGGPKTKYAVSVAANEWSGGSAVTPVSEEEAMAWCQEHGKTSVILTHFPQYVTEA
jgi:hypothetical protein